MQTFSYIPQEKCHLTQRVVSTTRIFVIIWWMNKSSITLMFQLNVTLKCFHKTTCDLSKKCLSSPAFMTGKLILSLIKYDREQERLYCRADPTDPWSWTPQDEYSPLNQCHKGFFTSPFPPKMLCWRICPIFVSRDILREVMFSLRAGLGVQRFELQSLKVTFPEPRLDLVFFF